MLRNTFSPNANICGTSIINWLIFIKGKDNQALSVFQKRMLAKNKGLVILSLQRNCKVVGKANVWSKNMACPWRNCLSIICALTQREALGRHLTSFRANYLAKPIAKDSNSEAEEKQNSFYSAWLWPFIQIWWDSIAGNTFHSGEVNAVNWMATETRVRI